MKVKTKETGAEKKKKRERVKKNKGNSKWNGRGIETIRAYLISVNACKEIG